MPEMRQHELAGRRRPRARALRRSPGRSAPRGRSRGRPGASRPAPRTRPRATTPMSPMPIASVTLAPQPSSSLARNAGSPPPGSPATSTRSTLDAAQVEARARPPTRRDRRRTRASARPPRARSRSIASRRRSVFPVPTGTWLRPMRSNAASAAPGDERAGVVRRDDPLAGDDARGGVAARRAGDPVLEIAGRQRDVAGRARRAARRVDPDDLGGARRGARRSGSRRVAVAFSSPLSVKRQLRDLGEPACSLGGCDAGGGELLAVERRALEEVRELHAVARGRRARAARPRERLDLGGEHQLGRRRTAARTRPPPRPRPPAGSPSGRSRSSARCASRPAVRARIGTAFTGVRREAEVEHHGGDRHRHVQRQRLSHAVGDGVAQAPREQRRGARSRRARPRARGSARPAGRAAGAPDARTPAPCRRPMRGRAGDLRPRPPPARRRPRPAAAPASRSRAHASAVPRTTGPQPRIPAATAPWSEPGSAASVIRAATLVGIIPCSAIATRSRSRK